MPDLVAVIIAGCVLGLGAFLIVAALLPSPVNLRDAIDLLDGGSVDQRGVAAAAEHQVGGGLGRIGFLLYQRLRLPLPVSTVRLLALNGRPVGDFFAEKLVWVIVLAAVPALLGTAFNLDSAWVAVISLGCAVGGYFLPDLLLRRSAQVVRSGAMESLFMLFDLVVLERLANRSVTQALHSAASLSDVTLFIRIRSALERARLEQVPPWPELRRLAAELDLPEIADLADVLQLDEQGAALADPLRARLREMRNGYLTQLKQTAQIQTERMTIWMTLPVMIFGAMLLAPPLLLVTQG